MLESPSELARSFRCAIRLETAGPRRSRSASTAALRRIDSVDRHLRSLDDATLISGGNDETDGNVQLVRRRDGWSVDGHLTEIHPEIGMATEEEPRGDGCQVMAAERPQLLVTNLMVASAMLSCLWQITERGSVPYSEVYLDAIQNAARSRSWFRVPASAQ